MAGRLITIDGEVYEVVDEAPERTSMFLINRTRQQQLQVRALEQQLAEARAALAEALAHR